VHDALRGARVEGPELLLEIERLCDALPVRPVGAEQDPLDTDQLGQRLEVLLEVGRRPDVSANRVERIFVECPRRLVRLLAQSLGEQMEPGGAVLDARDAQARMAGAAITLIVSAPPAMCGNAIVEGGEQCDDGNTAAGDCCSMTCLFEAAATVCRA